MIVEFEKSDVEYKNILEKIALFIIYKFLDLLFYINAYDHTHKTFDYQRIALLILAILVALWFILSSLVITLAAIKFIFI